MRSRGETAGDGKPDYAMAGAFGWYSSIFNRHPEEETPPVSSRYGPVILPRQRAKAELLVAWLLPARWGAAGVGLAVAIHLTHG